MINVDAHLLNWQETLAEADMVSGAGFTKRPDIIRAYRPPKSICFFPADAWGRGSGLHQQESGIAPTTAIEIFKYGMARLAPLIEIPASWACEVFQSDDGLFVASYFNIFGGRLTLHGITTTKNRCGVTGDNGLIAQA